MPRRDVLTPEGEKGLSYASRLLELGALLAILGVFALAGCYISRTIDQATASDVNNRNFTFTSGEVFHTALKNTSTALAFSNNAQGTHLRRDTVIPQWFQASKAVAASDGHAVHF